ncbi:little elongation complex subunit 2 isoform X3 [Salmo salar]|uniref:Little elongation complex subunit 2 isoform X3 n=1 Tax=Salmo salar TaxID=8030 RepID=A0ABM3DTJ8_SALSA|nr:little elongation complex subunit 2 isoform X3 [Salmo salar]
MELTWEDVPLPAPDCLVFNRDLYDKFSLAPTIKGLWDIAVGSPTVKVDVKEQLQDPSGPAKLPSTQNQSNSSSNINDERSGTGESSSDSQDEDSKVHRPPASEAVSRQGPSHPRPSGQDPSLPGQVPELFPEPRIPYPCFSRLTSKDQLTYLHVLTSKQPREASQTLLLNVNSERSEFMRYLQEVARMCPDDYNYISQGAALYSEEYLRACLDQIRRLPQLYQIHEITSLTGGNFSSSLQLNFEKQLLTMGEVLITDHKVVPNEAQLAFDYETVSSDIPPVKKAKLSHSGVSTDSNAEKLSGRYEPHVVLSRESLVRLLDNHGPDFTDPWELPVVVKTNPGRGSSQSKTVFVDPPLLQTELTVRERSQLFHEESMKLSVNKTGTKNVFHLMTETPAMNKQLPAESSQRRLVSFETSGLDFGLDLTDLETFGEATQSPKRLKTHNLQKDLVSQPKDLVSQPKDLVSPPKDLVSPPKDLVSPPKDLVSPPKDLVSPPKDLVSQPKDLVSQPTDLVSQPTDLVSQPTDLVSQPTDLVSPPTDLVSQPKTKSKQYSGTLVKEESKASRTPDEEGNLFWTNRTVVSETEEREQSCAEQSLAATVPSANQLKPGSVQDSEEQFSSGGDSEDERLVIDDPVSPVSTTNRLPPAMMTQLSPTRQQDTPRPPCASSPPPLAPLCLLTTTPRPPCASSPPPLAPGTRRVARKAKVPGGCDQLDQILAMQKAMLKPKPNQTQDPARTCSSQAAEPLSNPNPQSLVKPSVSNYLDSTQDGETYVDAPSQPGPIDNRKTVQQKRLLCEDLMGGAEDEEDYLSPEEGNLLYKLYSLQDLLLLVRSDVYLAHTRRLGTSNKVVPVYVLSKMEYQLSYGVESLTKTEACRLWAETLLHSSTVPYIGHISAHTSKVALLRKLPETWKPNASCDFKPTKSLNILHHLLKKITGLSEGHYLIGHKAGEPFVTIFKAVEGRRIVREAYDLQQTHSSVPPPSALGPVPWVPLDPTLVLPFHQKHSRPPCTFPPPDLQQHKARKGGAGEPGKPGPSKGMAGPANPASSQGAKKKKKKKKNKGKRTQRRDKWMKKQIQRSVQQNSP